MGTHRRRAVVLAAALCLGGMGLGAVGLAGTAQADKAQVPADDITGQDHPADVFVEYFQYFPPTVHVKAGGHIKFGNYDMFPYGAGIAAHSMEEAIPGCTSPPYNAGTGCERYPRFSSALTDHGYVHNVEGVDKLPKGEYPFTCQVHSQMRGTLVID